MTRSQSFKPFLTGLFIAATLCGATPLMAEAPSQIKPAVSSHVVTFEGSNNFRDIGGYKTIDGHRVKMGLVYRSAAMHRVTEAGFAKLQALGIRTNVDFRSTEERTNAPVHWPEAMHVTVFSVDYANESSVLRATLADKNVTAEKAALAMEQFYLKAPFQFGPQYKTLMHELVNNHAPLVYNCTAGKDRTGVATAILLRLLGVPHDTIVEDYLLSNQYYVPDMPRPGEKQDASMAFFRSLPPEVTHAIMGTDARYIDAAFKAIESREGGWDRYVHEDLGLTDQDIVTLKANLLQ